MRARNQMRTCSIALSLTCAACSMVPKYDVPSDSSGAPTVNSITQRIVCELVGMTVDDGNNEVFRPLVDQKYIATMSLSLDTTDLGGVAPSLSYINPFMSSLSFVLNANATISKSRDQNFTENLEFSMQKLRAEMVDKPEILNCPQADTNLAGDLGIRQMAYMALNTHYLNVANPPQSQGSFGGYVNFIVTKNLSSIGPTWTLKRFKGPGAVNLSEVNTDKLTIAFAPESQNGKPGGSQQLLQQLLTSQINAKLDALQSSISQ